MRDVHNHDDPQSVNAARQRLLKGDRGVLGNERLTAVAGAVLLVLIVVELATTPNLRPLLSAHVFVGVVLAGPLTVKMASTGWRFVRYYMHSAAYVRKGPPRLALRILAPLLVLTTLIVIVTGIGLLVVGPNAPEPFGHLHVISSILWVPLVALHVAAYLRRTKSQALDEWRVVRDLAGRRWRTGVNVSAVTGGTAAAIVMLPTATPWVSWIDTPGHAPGPGFFVVSIVAAALAVALARVSGPLGP